MATDWAFYHLTRPMGLLAIAFAIALPFGIWRLLMGKSFASFGIKPLAAGYVAALTGLVLLNFISSYSEFTNRVERGVLEEAGRWATVLGWTLYTGVLSSVFVLPVLGLLGVPTVALLLKSGRLGYRSGGVVLVLFWLLLTVGLWSVPTNTWHETHRLESLRMILFEVLPGILAIGIPFLGAVLLTTRSARHAGT